MSQPKRTPGTTNAPGGEWYSTPPEKRHHKPKRLSLTPEALEALAYLAGPRQESAEVSAAIVERAERRGWKRAEKK